jgi:hypothetical protein
MSVHARLLGHCRNPAIDAASRLNFGSSKTKDTLEIGAAEWDWIQIF